jgi:hypothetical protein
MANKARVRKTAGWTMAQLLVTTVESDPGAADGRSGQ